MNEAVVFQRLASMYDSFDMLDIFHKLYKKELMPTELITRVGASKEIVELIRAKLLEFSVEHGISLIEINKHLDVLDEETQGYFDHETNELFIKANPDIMPVKFLDTFVHEITHYLLRQLKPNMASIYEEWVAQTTAYTVLFNYGIDTIEYSLLYLLCYDINFNCKQWQECTKTVSVITKIIVKYISGN